MGREARASQARRIELGGGDLSGFGIGRVKARRRRAEERRDDILLPASASAGLTGEQCRQLLELMRRARDEYRAGKRAREAVSFALTDSGEVVEI